MPNFHVNNNNKKHVQVFCKKNTFGRFRGHVTNYLFNPFQILTTISYTELGQHSQENN